MKRWSFCLLCLLLSLSVRSQSASAIKAYIEQFRQIALEQEHKYGVPASITLAQGILESAAGTSSLTKSSNNHFGIKTGSAWSGPIHKAWDDEPQKSSFRGYHSAAESYEDHSKFLRHNARYKSLFLKSVYDYRGWAIGLQKAGYATSPTYARALIGYIDAYRLYAVNGGVKLRGGQAVVIKKTISRQELAESEELTMSETEVSEEEENIGKTIQRYRVVINGVRCTIVFPGETMSLIAMKYDIPRNKLLAYNETTSESDVQEGDIVFLEEKKKKYTGANDYYRVKAGDSLYDIAQQFGIKSASLARMNHMSLLTTLREGDKIRLK